MNRISMNTLDPMTLLQDYAGWLAAGAVAMLMAVTLLGVSIRSMRRRRRERREQEAALSAMQADLSALCAGSAGFADRLARLEQQVRGLLERQEQLELHASGDRTYAQAIQMVHKGADVQTLIGTFGLNPREADLLVRMHGMQKTA